MLIEAAHRAEAAAKEMLAGVHAGSASCAELREALAICKSFMAAGSAFQTGAASVIAKAERHGDGGTQVLADTAGLTRHEARSQVTTARAIETTPAVRDAVEAGRVSQANAKRLAEAIDKTDAEAVESDSELLAKAESMRPEQFTREARRWTADRQHDRGEADYRRLRAKRRVRVWDADDGLVHLHGEFDPVAGRRIVNRLRTQASQLYETDKKQAGGERRSFDQCMADALDNLTSSTGDSGGDSKAFADICVVAHLDKAAGKLVAETPEGQRLPDSVLEELACNAKFTGLLYDHDGKPIWRAHSVRGATKAQRQILFARYGGCFHCKAHPALCDIHHIEPVSQGGLTELDNLVPACWDCHQKIHHHGWRIHKHPDGHHTLHPPDRINYGPAHAPEHPPPLFTAQPLPTPGPPTRAGPAASTRPTATTSPAASPSPAATTTGTHSPANPSPAAATATRTPASPSPAAATGTHFPASASPAAAARAALRRAKAQRHTDSARNASGEPGLPPDSSSAQRGAAGAGAATAGPAPPGSTSDRSAGPPIPALFPPG